MAEITAYQWAKGIKSLRAAGGELGGELLINNQPPKHGQIMTNPNLAQTFQVHSVLKCSLYMMHVYVKCNAIMHVCKVLKRVIKLSAMEIG